jgi:hypothetical protein
MSAIGTKRTINGREPMSAFGGKADINETCGNVCLRPKAEIAAVAGATLSV